jgi:hypothetical protein
VFIIGLFSFGSFCLINKFIDELDFSINKVLKRKLDEQKAAKKNNCQNNKRQPPVGMH